MEVVDNYVTASQVKAKSGLGWISDVVNRIALSVTIFFMVIMIIDVALQVVYRYILNDSLAWSDELARYLFMWSVFLGATVGIKHMSHPSFGSVVQLLPVKVQSVVTHVGRSLTIAYCIVLMFLSLEVIGKTSTLSPALQIPVSLLYWIFPIFSLVSIVHLIAKLWDERRGVPFISWIISLLVLGVIVYAGMAGLHFSFNFPAILVAALLILFSLGVPIAFVLGLTSLSLVMLSTSFPLEVIPQRMFLVSDNFSLMAIPFFMLTGALMQVGGVAERLVRLASALVGWVKGGLGYSNILVSAFFADISGSAVADTAAIGSVMLPGMIKRGYEKPFATALQAASGTLGVLIPPSITTILFAVTANISVTQMFLASFLPALLVIFSFAIVVFITAKKRNLPKEPKPTGKQLWEAVRGAFFPIWTPVIILGGILSGMFTTTEAGVVAIVYTLIVMLMQKELNWKNLRHSFIDAVNGTSRVMLIVSSAFMLGWLLVVSQLSQKIADTLFSFSHNTIIVLIIVNIFLAVVHIVLETNSTILLIVPILMPILNSIGIDPIHFGILLLINSAIGLLTPPVGVILYIASGITNIKVETLARAVVPFILMLVVDLILVIVFPDIVSFLPSTLGR